MPVITNAVLNSLRVGFNHSFKKGLESAEPQYLKVATHVPGTGKSTTYGWLGKFVKFREWVGDRVFKSLKEHSYTIVNKKFEASESISRDDIEDDQFGMYTNVVEDMGQSAAEHPDEMVFPLLFSGDTNPCFDGQNYFDTDHPVYPETDGTGAPALVSNFGGGIGRMWCLLDDTRSIKPMIYQERRKMAFHTWTQDTSESVKLRDEYEFGADGRNNAGYSFWQLAYGSRQPITPDNIEAADAAMSSFKADGDKAIKVKPRLLVVQSQDKWAAKHILDKQFLASGESNPLYKAYELLVVH